MGDRYPPRRRRRLLGADLRADAPPQVAEGRQSYRITFAVLALSGLCYSILTSLVLPALPDIQRELGASETSLGWMLSGFLLSASVFTPILGRLGDLYGKERMLVLVLVLLIVGALIAALAPSMPVLILGRIIQGAAGGIFPLSFGIIRDEFPREKVASGIGLISATLGVGGAVGLVLAGTIVEQLGYRWLFWLPLLVMIPALIATHLFVPESPVRAEGRINWLSAGLMSSAISLALVALTLTERWGWISVGTVGLMALAVVLGVAWVRHELHSREPLVDMRMMRITGVWTTNLVAVLVGAGMYASFVLLPQYVQEPAATGYGFGESITGAATYQLPVAAGMILMGQLAGRLERRFGSKRLLVVGAAVAASAFALLAAARLQHWEVYLATGLIGIGIGLSFAAMPNLIVANVDAEQTGVATGMNAVMRTLGGAFGGQVAAAVLAANLGLLDSPTAHGYTLAFALCAAAAGCAALAALLVPGRTRVLARA